MTTIDTFVCWDDEHIYPARLDRSDRGGGCVYPGFTLDAVREIAAHTEEAVEIYGHERDQITVIEGEPQPIVLHIRWGYFDQASPASSVTVVKADANGLYWIGWEWFWSEVENGPLFHSERTAHEAKKQVLKRSAHRVGEILREQVPDATSCLVDLSELGRIVRVFGEFGDDWPVTPGQIEDGLFDAETLSDADEVVRLALNHGRAADTLEAGGWRPAQDIGRPDLHRVMFAPRGLDPVGEGPLEEARTTASEARRALLTATVPYLAEDVVAACPSATGLIVDPAAEQPFLLFLTDTAYPDGRYPAPARLVQKVRDRLASMFAYRPSAEDLTVSGWKPVAVPELDGAYALIFPTE
ncbi:MULTISPECIES: hypothetical protein [unclassified Streptomyces]|uniref:hypothetical protein n=1 Tax=unclassified Streptomyces TaxID=2593676 RepID=UPI0035DEC49A